MMKKGKRSETTHFVPISGPLFLAPDLLSRDLISSPEVDSRAQNLNPIPQIRSPSTQYIPASYTPRNPLRNALKTASPSQKCQYSRYVRLGISHLASSNSSKQGTQNNPTLEKREDYQQQSQDTKH